MSTVISTTTSTPAAVASVQLPASTSASAVAAELASIKQQLDLPDAPLILLALQQLQPLVPSITPVQLRDTGLGLQVNKLRKHSNSEVATLAKSVLDQLKSNVRATSSSSAPGSTPMPASPLPGNESSALAPSPPASNGKKRLSTSMNGTAGSALADGNGASANKKQAVAAKPAAAAAASPAASPTAASAQPAAKSPSPPPMPLNAQQSQPANTTSYTLGKLDEPFRNTIQAKLHGGLCLDGDVGPFAVELAVRIEALMYEWAGRRTDSKYKTKFRELGMNISDKNNPDLRYDLLSGELSPEDLINKPITELASKSLKEERMAEQKELWEARRTDLNTGKGMTDMWRYVHASAYA